MNTNTNLNSNIMELTYDEKLEIANKYIGDVAGMTWNDLEDINSLHDADDEEDIRELCKDRLIESGFPINLLNE